MNAILGADGALTDWVVGETGEDGRKTIDIFLGAPARGQIRLDVAYERIMDAGAVEARVPTVTVDGAEVEHGRIAVEALAAVGRVVGLSNLELAALPRHLVLKTTNPILFAYRYVQAKTPFELSPAITRHREIEVQVATIEKARYATLFTRDGPAVTTARPTRAPRRAPANRRERPRHRRPCIRETGGGVRPR